eukprot:NODE_154_length_16838_cov_0.293327.p5 type:complete len:360 gc:universal NODE_154_length_16838_cov_0.293327:14583-15662(+)
MFDHLVRENIKRLKPYTSARHDIKEGILLDANENSIGDSIGCNLNRYPDPFQRELKKKIANFRKVDESNIFIGNGSDEAIDLIIRVFCEPKQDSVLITPPTYGMYGVQADIHDVTVLKANLLPDFQLDMAEMLSQISKNPKIVWLCSPGNPTGTCLTKSSIKAVIQASINSIVVIDEAYIDFCPLSTCIDFLSEFENVVILQTCSKSFGLAGLRLGIALASDSIIAFMNKIKTPYNLSQLTISHGLKAFSKESIDRMNEMTTHLNISRYNFREWLSQFTFVRILDQGNANFVLCQILVDNKPNNDVALKMYKSLVDDGIITRFRGNDTNCEATLRISIGNDHEMIVLKSLFEKNYNLNK